MGAPPMLTNSPCRRRRAQKTVPLTRGHKQLGVGQHARLLILLGNCGFADQARVARTGLFCGVGMVGRGSAKAEFKSGFGRPFTI